jgi:hypothetical protein
MRGNADVSLARVFFFELPQESSERHDERGKRLAEEGGTCCGGGGSRRDMLLCSDFSEWSPARTAAPPAGVDVQGGFSRKGNHTGAL